MKSRRLALANHLENPVANGRDLHLVVRGNSEILSFASPFYGVILADNNNSPSDNSDDLYGGYSGSFSATTVIILAVLISAFFVIVFFSICFRRCATEEENLRTSRRGGAGMDNGLVRMVDPGHRGLDRAVIESFPVFSYDIVKGLKAQRKETHECAVCICEFEDDEQLRLLPKCSHAFHPECIDRWLFSHTTCPVCRISLVPTDEANPAGTGYGIIESPVITAPHDLGLVTMGASYRSASTGNDVEIPVAPSSTDSQESFAVVGHDQSEKFRRSYSTGHSLVRIRKDSDQLATEWYISTTEGLKPGHHRNCSLTAPSHSRSPGPSTSGTLPGLSKQASMSSTASHIRDTSGSGRRWYERSLRSERLNISSIYPTSLLRSFSVQRTPAYSGNQESSTSSQQDRGKTYLQPLKRTLKRLTGREKEEADNSHSGRGSSRGVSDNPHIERGSSSEVADNSQSGRGFSRAGAEENGSHV